MKGILPIYYYQSLRASEKANQASFTELFLGVAGASFYIEEVTSVTDFPRTSVILRFITTKVQKTLYFRGKEKERA